MIVGTIELSAKYSKIAIFFPYLYCDFCKTEVFLFEGKNEFFLFEGKNEFFLFEGKNEFFLGFPTR